jgi:hypothetical protein
MTFQTPPEPVGGPVNLALEAAVTGVSSEWSDEFSAANAFDGDATTEWSSRGDADDAWVEIDLGFVQRVDEVIFRTRSMNDGSSITDTFSVTADGVAVGEFAAGLPAAIEVDAQVLRFDVVKSSGGNTGAIEILVLGPSEE